NDGLTAEVECAAALHATLGNSMEVAADDERDAAGHPSHGRHEPVVLLEPAALPIGLGQIDREPTVAVKDVRIPLAPLPGAPARRIRGDVNDVPHLARRHACLEPSLYCAVDKDCA